MSIIYVLLAIVALGAVVWLIQTKVTFLTPTWKNLVSTVAIILVLLWVLDLLGLWGYLTGPKVPRIR